MRILLLSITGMLFPVLLLSQERTSVLVNLGFHQLNSTGNYLFNGGDEGGYLVKQKSAPFFDINVLFSKKLTCLSTCLSECPVANRFSLTYGAGVNQKGFTQTTMMSDGTKTYSPSYTFDLRRTYMSLYVGATAKFKICQRADVQFSALVNPDVDIESVTVQNTGFSPLAFATRTYAGISYRMCEKTSLHLSTYFQYALTDYTASADNSIGGGYKPYGFGLNLGLAFQ